MAITNRHIHKDWNKFLITPQQGRRTSLCGRKVVAKYTGTPGIDPQPLSIGNRPGWCMECMDSLLEWYTDTFKSIPMTQMVTDLYNLVFFEMFSFMKHCVDNGFTFENAPERSSDAPEDRRYHARLYAQRRKLALQGYIPEPEELAAFYGKNCLYPGCTASDTARDHVVPLVEGGDHGVHNLQPLCKRHNSMKHNTTVDYRTGDIWVDVDDDGNPVTAPNVP